MSPEQIAITNLITTIALCVITAVYVLITNLIQKDQRKHFEMTNRPYFSFDHFAMGVRKESETIKSLQPQIHFKNVGNVILEYQIEELEFVVNNAAGKNNNLINNGGYVFPQMQTTFYFPIEESFNSDTLEKINNVSIRYKLSYKIPETTKSYTSERKFEFQFDPVSDQTFGFIFISQTET